VLRRAGRCLAQPAAEPADAQATRLHLDRRLELVILPNEPHQLLQFLVFPHQPLDLMPKPLIIGAPLSKQSAPYSLEFPFLMTQVPLFQIPQRCPLCAHYSLAS
uniref:Uncharacterized protein n=1 Tax=Balaenoptera musculus TaxID=9771 RepID=A0A8C0DPB9_BALMU